MASIGTTYRNGCDTAVAEVCIGDATVRATWSTYADGDRADRARCIHEGQINALATLEARLLRALDDVRRLRSKTEA